MMNKGQRERLRKILDELGELQEEEQDKYDNMPENLEDSERAEKFQENADGIEEAIDLLKNIVEG